MYYTNFNFTIDRKNKVDIDEFADDFIDFLRRWQISWQDLDLEHWSDDSGYYDSAD